MAKLSEYIGSLVSSITEARMMSDIKTVTVAEEYARHDLLKHFSVPRMRVENVELTVPVGVEGLEEKLKDSFEPINAAVFNSKVYREVVNSLEVSTLPIDISRRLRSAITKQTQILDTDLQERQDLTPLRNYAKELSNYIREFENDLQKIYGERVRIIDPEARAEYLESVLQPEIVAQTQESMIEKLNVIVEAHRLREEKPENLIYIKIKIAEDGMEWNRTENTDGRIESKLLPE